MYKIIRFYEDPDRHCRVVRKGLTLQEAQAHCVDPETSSSTCAKEVGVSRTVRVGGWFDGYSKE